MKKYEKFTKWFLSNTTSRFGNISESIMEIVYNLNIYDRKKHIYEKDGKRISINFSIVRQSYNGTVNKYNIIDMFETDIISNRIISTNDMNVEFNCNIQQLHLQDFDLLYVGLCFDDKVFVFNINQNDIKNLPNYSSYQHNGNPLESQLHITNDNIQLYKDKYLIDSFSYEDLYKHCKTYNNKKLAIERAIKIRQKRLKEQYGYLYFGGV